MLASLFYLKFSCTANISARSDIPSCIKQAIKPQIYISLDKRISSLLYLLQDVETLWTLSFVGKKKKQQQKTACPKDQQRFCQRWFHWIFERLIWCDTVRDDVWYSLANRSEALLLVKTHLDCCSLITLNYTFTESFHINVIKVHVLTKNGNIHCYKLLSF